MRTSGQIGDRVSMQRLSDETQEGAEGSGVVPGDEPNATTATEGISEASEEGTTPEVKERKGESSGSKSPVLQALATSRLPSTASEALNSALANG